MHQPSKYSLEGDSLTRELRLQLTPLSARPENVGGSDQVSDTQHESRGPIPMDS